MVTGVKQTTGVWLPHDPTTNQTVSRSISGETPLSNFGLILNPFQSHPRKKNGTLSMPVLSKCSNRLLRFMDPNSLRTNDPRALRPGWSWPVTMMFVRAPWVPINWGQRQKCWVESRSTNGKLVWVKKTGGYWQISTDDGLLSFRGKGGARPKANWKTRWAAYAQPWSNKIWDNGGSAWTPRARRLPDGLRQSQP